ncbi:MAG: DUF424 family protein [Nanoarchaeota archaeon]
MPKSDITVKKHVSPDKRLILVLCDSDQLGKRYSEGKLFLDLTVPFYQGHAQQEQTILQLVYQASIIHVVGKESCALVRKAGYDITPATIQGVPHVEVVIS